VVFSHVGVCQSAVMTYRYEMDSKVCGIHVYQVIWMPVMDEELPCEHKEYNGHDLCAVAVKKVGVIVGHLPRMHSATFWSFLLGSGSITCRDTGTWRYSIDLEKAD